MRHPPLNRGLVTARPRALRARWLDMASAADQPPSLGVKDFYDSGRFAVETIMPVEDYEETS
jgi:hypothetical protein